MSKREFDRLLHIRDSCAKLLAFMDGKSREDLDRDDGLALIVSRLTNIIADEERRAGS